MSTKRSSAKPCALLAYYFYLSAALGSVYETLTGVIALLLWAQLTSGAIFLCLALCAHLEAATAGLPAAAPDAEGSPPVRDRRPGPSVQVETSHVVRR